MNEANARVHASNARRWRHDCCRRFRVKVSQLKGAMLKRRSVSEALQPVCGKRERCGRWHATDRYRQSQFVGLTRLQLDEIGRERQVQRQGAQRAEARAELSVELAQARILPAYELGR